ncbi:prion-inhibition and propagation-domain-containing protein [Lophiotrema nucula]|uniref:Prion-inhibition and propagation-domain-containing protein n=1 Tax=Lophiotrema nucula TaxID=690887 RepID=A0A6A5Z0A7_9PLEO|nr:prion-inhibition and propagation-domain-containing protein [Lophiotrema nucula]
MASTANQNGLATPPATPTSPSKEQVLSNVLSLATVFSTCVEAFNQVFPAKDSDHAQKVALAKLGVQQGRLLIFGDAVGISSPPANIARHMIPSHPGLTNPDPHLPVNFGIRDARLDDETINKKVRAALDEIAGRPAHLSREELMGRYGLKTPKRLYKLEYPALDHNRLEAFREKYALLQDLVAQTGGRGAPRRTMSMSAQHWTVNNADKFDEFVAIVRKEVDGLIALLDVRAQVDRGMKTDIRAMGWHPDLSGLLVRHDWEKLRLIREACFEDYPEYVEVTEFALKYISDELKGTTLAHLRAAYEPLPPVSPRRKSSDGGAQSPTNGTRQQEKEKRPGFLSMFKHKSWNRSKSSKLTRERSKSIASTTSDDQQDPQRSLSETMPYLSSEEANGLEPVRSHSMSAIPDEPAPFDLASRLETTPTHDDSKDVGAIDIDAKHPLVHADTANSLIDRHDMYKGMGRVETKDIRAKAHDWAHGA